jgi:hypothetical protein
MCIRIRSPKPRRMMSRIGISCDSCSRAVKTRWSCSSNVVRPGTRLGAYELVSPIGAGGMGEGLSRARSTARARRGQQGPVGVTVDGSGTSGPLRAGGPCGRRDQSSQHPRGLRHWLAGGHAVHRFGAAAGSSSGPANPGYSKKGTPWVAYFRMASSLISTPMPGFSDTVMKPFST